MKQNLLPRMGLDPQRLRFASYTAVACIIALFAAWGLGLEHPQWAGMSVWAASQPLRGQVFEKSAYRALGTFAGVIVGIGLVFAMQISPYLLVLGLALWIGFCTWASNLQRGIAAYGTALAGFSASMVALLNTAHPDKVFALGLDRFLTVLTGVIVATLAGAIFAGRTKPARLKHELRGLVTKSLQLLGKPDASSSEIEEMLREIARFEEGLEPHAAGSANARVFVKAARRVLIELTLLLLRKPAFSEADSVALAAIAGEIDGKAVEAPRPDLPHQLSDLFNLLHQVEGQSLGKTIPALGLYRDLNGARESGLRAGGVILLVGTLWQLTGWSQLTYLLLGLSVMLSVFSTMELPAFILRYVAMGQAVGGVAAVICQMLLWPLAPSTFVQILMLIPFILIGVLFSAHRRTFMAAMDYHMVFLLLMMPHVPFAVSFTHALTTALAVVAAPILALLCFKTIFPVHLQRRADHVARMFDHDLAAIAGKPDALAGRLKWSSRFAHRSLRLLRLNEKLDVPVGQSVAQIQTYAQLGRAAFAAHEVLAQDGASMGQRRLARQVLARMVQDPTPKAASAAVRRLMPYAKGEFGQTLSGGTAF